MVNDSSKDGFETVKSRRKQQHTTAPHASSSSNAHSSNSSNTEKKNAVPAKKATQAATSQVAHQVGESPEEQFTVVLTGLPSLYHKSDIIRRHNFCGQYGRICKIASKGNAVHVSYCTADGAKLAAHCLDGWRFENSRLGASAHVPSHYKTALNVEAVQHVDSANWFPSPPSHYPKHKEEEASHHADAADEQNEAEDASNDSMDYVLSQATRGGEAQGQATAAEEQSDEEEHQSEPAVTSATSTPITAPSTIHQQLPSYSLFGGRGDNSNAFTNMLDRDSFGSATVGQPAQSNAVGSSPVVSPQSGTTPSPIIAPSAAPARGVGAAPLLYAQRGGATRGGGRSGGRAKSRGALGQQPTWGNTYGSPQSPSQSTPTPPTATSPASTTSPQSSTAQPNKKLNPEAAPFYPWSVQSYGANGVPANASGLNFFGFDLPYMYTYPVQYPTPRNYFPTYAMYS